MATYTYRCETCGNVHEVFQSIAAYCREPDVPTCCGRATERFFDLEAVPALANASFGDRHYDGLRAPDGTDISSRTKHREYMRRNGLTTTDDFTGEWKRQQKERERYRKAEHTDRELRQDIAEALTKRRT